MRVREPFLAKHRGSIFGVLFLCWLGSTIASAAGYSLGFVALLLFLAMPILWLVGHSQKKEW